MSTYNVLVTSQRFSASLVVFLTLLLQLIMVYNELAILLK